jgi:hypothetical protein
MVPKFFYLLSIRYSMRKKIVLISVPYLHFDPARIFFATPEYGT